MTVTAVVYLWQSRLYCISWTTLHLSSGSFLYSIFQLCFSLLRITASLSPSLSLFSLICLAYLDGRMSLPVLRVYLPVEKDFNTHSSMCAPRHVCFNHENWTTFNSQLPQKPFSDFLCSQVGTHVLHSPSPFITLPTINLFFVYILLKFPKKIISTDNVP